MLSQNPKGNTFLRFEANHFFNVWSCEIFTVYSIWKKKRNFPFFLLVTKWCPTVGTRTPRGCPPVHWCWVWMLLVKKLQRKTCSLQPTTSSDPDDSQCVSPHRAAYLSSASILARGKILLWMGKEEIQLTDDSTVNILFSKMGPIVSLIRIPGSYEELGYDQNSNRSCVEA